MSTEFKDYYDILGVPEDADADTIKRAYRKLARTYHPDVNKEESAQQRFTDVSEAYEVLGDEAKRKEYDQLRTYGYHGGESFEVPPEWQQQQAGGFRQTRTDFDPEAFSDFFSSLFGGRGGGASGAEDLHGFPDLDAFTGRRRRGGAGAGRARGGDRHARLAVALEESYHGAQKTIQLERPQVDDQGRVVNRPQTLQVAIPKGVTDGEHIRLRGQGDPGPSGEAGDLYLEIGLIPHPLFTAEGKDLHLRLPVAPWEAALGAEIPVPTMGGTARLTIPAGSKDGDRLRLRGQGLPASPPGNQIVELQVAMPPPPSGRERELWQELASCSGFDPRAEWKGKR